jgi:Uma2 family endonuclease
MVQTKAEEITFADYLTYDDGTDTRYELVRGQPVPIPPPLWSYIRIPGFLENIFQKEIHRLGYAWDAIRGEIGQHTRHKASFRNKSSSDNRSLIHPLICSG